MQLKDLDSKENIAEFVESFYDKMLADEQLAPIFHEVAAIDIQQHLPRICSYWEKLLLGDKSYQRHTMNIHREVDLKQRFTPNDFERWLQHFTTTVTQEYHGDKADRALVIATTIAKNMKTALEREH